METTKKEDFAFGHGSLNAPIVVSNASSITFPTTHPHLKDKMAEEDSLSSTSGSSSIFGSELDGRCIALREKRQHITTLYAKFAALHAQYAHYTQQEMADDDDIFENVSDIDLERSQVCRAIIDLAFTATQVFDQDEVEDRQKLSHVAKNCDRKRKQMERRPFLMDANVNDMEMIRTCRIPCLIEICPEPKPGSRLHPFDTEVAGPDGANFPLPLTPTLRQPYAYPGCNLMPASYVTPNLRQQKARADADVVKEPNADIFASPFMKSSEVGQRRKGNHSHGGKDDVSTQGRAIRKSSNKAQRSIGKQCTGQTDQQRSEELTQRNGQQQWHTNSQQMQQQQQQLQVDLEQQLDQQKQTCMSLRQQCDELMDNAVKQQQQAKQQMDQMTAAHDKINRQAHQQAQQQQQLQIDLEQQLDQQKQARLSLRKLYDEQRDQYDSCLKQQQQALQQMSRMSASKDESKSWTSTKHTNMLGKGGSKRKNSCNSKLANFSNNNSSNRTSHDKLWWVTWFRRICSLRERIWQPDMQETSGLLRSVPGTPSWNSGT